MPPGPHSTGTTARHAAAETALVSNGAGWAGRALSALVVPFLLFGACLGLLAWAGLHLRDPALRALIPLRRK